jgi:hypothetical protein
MHFFIIIVAIIIIVILYFLFRKKTKENMPITIGMLAPQYKFYDRCINDCYRDLTGDSAPGQFLWFCTDKCQDKAMMRAELGIKDLEDTDYASDNYKNTPKKTPAVKLQNLGQEYRRHTECDLSEPKSIHGSMVDNTLSKDICATAGDLETCYCLKEIKAFCREQYCPFSANTNDCMHDCLKVRSVGCLAGLKSGWKFS